LAAAHHHVAGRNTKIKVLKRVAYDFRDEACLFFKIRTALPGNRG
jgi:transposase